MHCSLLYFIPLFPIGSPFFPDFHKIHLKKSGKWLPAAIQKSLQIREKCESIGKVDFLSAVFKGV
jgi:hypothetical protein